LVFGWFQALTKTPPAGFPKASPALSTTNFTKSFRMGVMDENKLMFEKIRKLKDNLTTTNMQKIEIIPPTSAEIVKRQIIDISRLTHLSENKELKRDAYKFVERLKTAVKGCSQKKCELDVVYTLAKGLENKPLGRLYERKQLGLQSMPRELRAYLAEPYYFDIDIVNAHYQILMQFAKKVGIPDELTEHISEYVHNRDQFLASVSDNRDVAKLQFIKVLYGSGCDFDEDEDEDTGAVILDASKLRDMAIEVTNISVAIWKMYPEYHSIQKIRKAEKSRVTFMSYILHSIERMVVMCASEYLDAIGRQLDCIIHDGGLLRKIHPDETFPEELLQNLREYVLKHTGWDLEWTCKPLKHSIAIDSDIPEHETYEAVKADFEKNHFLIHSKIYCIGDKFTDTDGLVKHGDDILYGKEQATVMFGPMTFKALDKKGQVVEKQFFKQWLEKDKNRRIFDKIDYLPKMQAPATTFNTFKGFEFELMIAENQSLIVDCRPFEQMQAYEYMYNVVCDGNQARFDYLMKLCYKIIYRPFEQSGVMPVLFSEDKGTGKTLFVQFLASLIGHSSCCFTSKADELFGKFNSSISNKSIVCYEEGSIYNPELIATLKDTVTATHLTIHKKGCEPYTQRNNAQFFQTTNHTSSIKAEPGCRRIFVLPVSSIHKGDSQYYTTLVKELNTVECKLSFYDFLDSHYQNTHDITWFQANRPIEDTFKHSQLKSECLVTKFFYYLHQFSTGDPLTGRHRFFDEFMYAKDIYLTFLSEMEKTKKDYTIFSFAKKLNNKIYESFIESIKTQENKLKYKIDFEKMEQFLIAQGYLD